MNKIKVYLSTSHDPWFNLATEDWIFRDMDPNQSVLFLWRNAETVVIGRFQNPWSECHTAKMEADGVKLARRQSGGGAVFQDLGNTNFTFMSGKELYSKEKNIKVITSALKVFGINAYASGRNDLLVDDHEGPKKISGSAFKETKDRAFHHGTLLIKANLSKLADYLRPDEKKLTSKGITSVRSRVANLTEFAPELDHTTLTQQIIEEFFELHQQRVEVETLNPESLAEIPALKKYYEFLKDWNWRFGETPKFNHHFDERLSFGSMDVHIDSHKGLIEKAVIFSDGLHPEMIEVFCEVLIGKVYAPAGIALAMREAELRLPMLKAEIEEFEAWCQKQIH